MEDRCCVCSKKVTTPGLEFFAFPAFNTPEYSRWIAFCKFPKNKNIKDLKICSNHFKPGAFVGSTEHYPTIKPRNSNNQRACSVPFCLNKGFDVPMLSKFPEDEILNHKWIKKFKMTKNTGINFIACSDHFIEQDYKAGKQYKYKTKQLKEDAVPTQNLPFQNYNVRINKQYIHLTDVCRPFAKKLLEIQNSGLYINEVEFKSALNEIAQEVKLRNVRKARAEEFADLCRGCLINIEPATSISDVLEDNKNIADELGQLLELNPFIIKIGDVFPQKLCNFCLRRNAEDLKKDFIESLSIMEGNMAADRMTMEAQEEESDSKSDILEESIPLEYDLIDFQMDMIRQPKTTMNILPNDYNTFFYALKCYICNLEFANDVERMQHFQIYHPPVEASDFDSSMVRCRICKSTVSAAAVPLNKHYRIHYESMNLLCDFCGEANFDTVSKYHLHLRKHKSDEYEVEFARKVLLEQQPIIYEYKIEITDDQILEPEKKEEPRKPSNEKYLCNFCGQKDFKYKKLYTLHLRQHKDKRRTENKVSKKFKCSE